MIMIEPSESHSLERCGWCTDGLEVQSLFFLRHDNLEELTFDLHVLVDVFVILMNEMNVA